MRARVQKWGNSLGIRIPKPIAQQIGLKEGAEVYFEVDNNALIIRPKSYDLEMLLAEIRPENIHQEIDTGEPRGRELW